MAPCASRVSSSVSTSRPSGLAMTPWTSASPTILHAGLGEVAGRGAPHRAEALDERGGVGELEAFDTGQRGLRDAVTADQFVEAHAVDGDREGVREPLTGLLLVVQQRVHGLDRRLEADLLDGLVDGGLAQPEVLPHRPEPFDVRGHGEQVGREDLGGPGVVRVEVDAALGAAERHVAGLGVVVEGFLGGHALRQSAHLVERAAGPHPQAPAADPAHQPVDDEVPAGTRGRIGPGDLEITHRKHLLTSAYDRGHMVRP